MIRYKMLGMKHETHNMKHKILNTNHKTYNMKLETKNGNMFHASGFTFQERGFTLIELLVVVFITATLTGIVTFNFSRLRAQQEISAAATELVSKIRTLQTDILAGKEVVSGTTPSAYEVVFTAGSASYRIDYITVSSTVTLETVNLTQNVRVGSLTGGSALRITSPFGKLLVDGAANRTLQITLSHATGSLSRTVTVDGISGRVSER